MYQDNRPCQVCGSEVRLSGDRGDRTLGVNEPDDTVDERICTNSECPTNQADKTPQTPKP
jgi:hypothetical protein